MAWRASELAGGAPGAPDAGALEATGIADGGAREPEETSEVSGKAEAGPRSGTLEVGAPATNTGRSSPVGEEAGCGDTASDLVGAVVTAATLRGAAATLAGDSDLAETGDSDVRVGADSDFSRFATAARARLLRSSRVMKNRRRGWSGASSCKVRMSACAFLKSSCSKSASISATRSVTALENCGCTAAAAASGAERGLEELSFKAIRPTASRAAAQPAPAMKALRLPGVSATVSDSKRARPAAAIPAASANESLMTGASAEDG